MQYYFLVNDRLKKLYEIVEDRFQNSTKPDYLHHTLRVANYCYQIGITLEVDLDIMIATALIHDIGKTIIPDNHVNCIEEEGSTILKNCGYFENKTQEIIRIAISHHPKKDEVLNDIYQQILFDADRLDCVGAFGIIRWYASDPGKKLENIIADAEMYLDFFSFTNRERYFYTDYAHKKANHLIEEGIDYANKLIEFCKLSIEQNANLFPIPIKENRD